MARKRNTKTRAIRFIQTSAQLKAELKNANAIYRGVIKQINALRAIDRRLERSIDYIENYKAMTPQIRSLIEALDNGRDDVLQGYIDLIDDACTGR